MQISQKMRPGQSPDEQKSVAAVTKRSVKNCSGEQSGTRYGCWVGGEPVRANFMDCNKKNDTVCRLLRSRAAASYLAISPWKLRELVRRGIIPVICDEPGGAWRFDRGDLDAYIQRTKRTF